MSTVQSTDLAATYGTIDQLVDALRAAGRHELIHYAGASYRDSTAHRVCVEWLADPGADEPTLKSRALQAVYGWHISPEQLRHSAVGTPSPE